MQRKRSSVYNAGPSVSHHHQTHSVIDKDPENSDPQLGVFGKYSDRYSFSDLRVEIDREHGIQAGYLRSKTSMMQSSGLTKITTRAKLTPTEVDESTLVTPSRTRQMPRRCQSASAVRKKLFHAVEQGGYQRPTHKLQAQIDALRNYTSTSLPRTPTTTPKGYRIPNADSPSICHGIPSVSRKKSSSKTQNQEECIAGVGIVPSRSASASILMFNPAQPTANSNTQYPAASVLVGGYRSPSVQLEVELVERLNEIGRSNLPEKTLSRTQACQHVLDRIVLQDEHYGRLLARIRDEFSTYVDMTSRKSPTTSSKHKGEKPWCACGQDIFDFVLLKQEKTVMKKRVASMQHEMESLQAAQRQTKAEDSSGRSNESIRDTCSIGSWPEDCQLLEDELDDVHLFQDMNQQHSRPQGVPMLNFSSLPSYNEEEDEEG